MLSIYILITVIPILWLCYTFLIKRKPLAHVPGPKGIPMLGNLLQLNSSHLYLQFTEWSKQYGPVFALNMAGAPAVVVSSKEALHEVLVKRGDEFAGRVHTFRTRQYPKLMAPSDWSPVFIHQKKVIMTHLKAYGSGLEESEKIIMKEMEAFVDKLKALCNGGKSVLQLDEHIEYIMGKIAASITFGREVEEEEIRVVLNILRSIDESWNVDFMGQMLDTFPWLRYLGHPLWKKIRSILSNVDWFYQGWKDRIYQAKQQGHDQSMNLLYKYIELFQGSKNDIGIEEDHCKMLLITVFAAAVGTTSKTLRFVIAKLIHNPSVQEKLRQESDDYLKGRSVTVKDRLKMDYHHAVILEITRLFPICPMLFPHRAVVDSQVMNLNIPKDTMIFPNIWALQHDENIWDKPMDFKPERYLDEDGKLVPGDHPARVNNLAFSAGPRVCAGETMATARMFLMVASLIQNFELLPATTLEDQPPCGSLDVIDGTAVSPLPFSARLKPRI